MPIYEYKCQSCEQLTEVMQRMSEAPLTTCENCGGDLKKLISAPAFKFKGTGWYVTDYADKEKGEKSGEKKGESKKSSDADDSGSKDSAKDSAAKDSSSKDSTSTPEKSGGKDKKTD